MQSLIGAREKSLKDHGLSLTKHGRAWADHFLPDTVLMSLCPSFAKGQRVDDLPVRLG